MTARNIAIFIHHISELKTLGGLIQELLRRNHNVFAFLNRYYVLTKPGVRGPVFQDLAVFKQDNFHCVEVTSLNEVKTLLVKNRIQAVAFHMGYEPHSLKSIHPKWIEPLLEERSNGLRVISIASHFYDLCAWPLEAVDLFDACTALSPYSVEVHKRILFSKKVSSTKIDRIFSERIKITGTALFDSLNQAYQSKQKQELKRCLFMVPDFNFPYGKTVLSPHRILRSFIEKIKHPKTPFYGLDLLKAPSFKEVFSAIQDFSRKNDMELVSKSRLKNIGWYDELLKSSSNKFIKVQEDEFFPLTLSQKLILESSVCVALRSFSILEAVIAGIPAMNIQCPVDDEVYYRFDPSGIFANEVRGNHLGGLNNFPGCSWSLSWKEAPHFFRNTRVEDFVLDPRKRDQYVEFFCGIREPKTASERQSDVIEELL